MTNSQEPKVPMHAVKVLSDPRSSQEARSATADTPELAPPAPIPALDSEVVPRARRHTLSNADKRRILQAADRCTLPGEMGALMRREGVYLPHSPPRPINPPHKPGMTVSVRPECEPKTGDSWPSAAWSWPADGGGLVWRSAQSIVTPFVVEVDSGGQVRAVGEAATPYKPNDAQTAHYLGRFVTLVRLLSIDPVVVRQNWLDAYGDSTD